MTRTRNFLFFPLQKGYYCIEQSGQLKQNKEKTQKTALRKHLSDLQSYCNLYFPLPSSYKPWQKLREYQDFFFSQDLALLLAHWGLAVYLVILSTNAILKSDVKNSSAENILQHPVPDLLKLKIQYYFIKNKPHGFTLMLFFKNPPTLALPNSSGST